MNPTAADLQNFVNGGAMDDLTTDKANQALVLASAQVDGYLRGHAKDSVGSYRPGVGEVVLMVAARIAANPHGVQFRDQVGAFSVSRQSAFQGFTLSELNVLNRYRKLAK